MSKKQQGDYMSGNVGGYNLGETSNFGSANSTTNVYMMTQYTRNSLPASTTNLNNVREKENPNNVSNGNISQSNNYITSHVESRAQFSQAPSAERNFSKEKAYGNEN